MHSDTTQLDQEADDPNAIATQGTDCVGYYSNCTAMCEEEEERPWVEVQPREGFGRGCSPAIADGTSDCVPGDDGCGNTDPCALTGVKVDTTAESGTIELTHDHSRGYKTCVWQIQCPGFASPRLTVIDANFHNGFTPAVGQHMLDELPWYDGALPSWFPAGSLVVSDGMGLGDSEAVMLAELVDASIPNGESDGRDVLGQVLQAKSRMMTLTYHVAGWDHRWMPIDEDTFTASGEFSAVWFCQ